MASTLAQTLSPANAAYSSQQTRARSSAHSPYYRPRTYTAHTGNNRLVRAATPLFTLMLVLRYTQYAANTKPLHQQLMHEINAFESAALAQGYSAEYVMVARYILCASIDKTIRDTRWGQSQQWDKCNLITLFQQAPAANERFVSILDHIRTAPKQYLDMLEIMYLCLSLGFNEYPHQSPTDKNTFNRLLDDIYHLICTQRGRVKKQLSVCQHVNNASPTRKSRGMPWWRSVIIGGALVSSLYVGFNYIAFTTTAPLVQTLQQVTTVHDTLY